MPRGRRLGVSRQARQHRSALVGLAHVAAPLMSALRFPKPIAMTETTNPVPTVPRPGKKPVNILMVDDQPAKLMSYEVVLEGLGENLIRANSGNEALEYLLRTNIAVVLVDVCMPELNGFELAS